MTAGTPISLDFVYGDVEERHAASSRWSAAAHDPVPAALVPRVARGPTRAGAGLEAVLVRHSSERPSVLRASRRAASRPPTSRHARWIEDQHWFLHTWQHDPTIQSMLVMLEAIHERFADDDCAAAWKRLVDSETPAISFQLLPIEQMGLSEDLYIKMNSRGKPLTPFENFKARFEQLLESSCQDRVEEFALRRSTALGRTCCGRYRGSDDIVDDEFLRYFHFVTEVCEWHDGRLPSRRHRRRSPSASTVRQREGRDASGLSHSDASTRGSESIPPRSSRRHSHADAGAGRLGRHEQGRSCSVAGSTVNLFAACCEARPGAAIVFSWPQTLLLYAVLLHRLYEHAGTSTQAPRAART